MILCIRWKGIYSHKWCMHSILPIAPRVKQPALHCHTYINSHLGVSIVSWSRRDTKPQRAAELDRFPLAAGGGERSAPNISGVISVFLTLGLRLGGGTTVRRLKVIRNCSKRYRSLREPAVPICIGFFRKPCLKNEKIFLIAHKWSNLDIVTEPLLLGGSLQRVFGMTVCTSSCTFVIYLVLFINSFL